MGASTNESWTGLVNLFPELDPTVNGTGLARLQQHAALVEQWNARYGLTAVTGDEAVLRHYGEALELWRIARERCGTPDSLVDIGSGAGYPGLAIAAVAPEMRVVLVEPRQKRATFLSLAAAEMGLTNVEVVCARAEDAARGPLRSAAGLVTARAVAAIPTLLEYTAPFAAAGGWLVFPKGSGAQAEVEQARGAAGTLGCTFAGITPVRPAVSTTITVIAYRQEHPADERYPRRAGIPARRPLERTTFHEPRSGGDKT